MSKPNHKAKGWYGHPNAHALASQGIKTTAKAKPSSMGEGLALVNTFLSLGAGGRLRADAFAKMKEYNDEVSNKTEWIADLDMNDDGEIVISDVQFSKKVDESQMNWNEDVTHKDSYPDPDHCVGYIHSHPPTVDPRPSAQDFILALTVDDLRLEANKQQHPQTMFGVVTADKVKFFAVAPKGATKRWVDKLKAVQNKNYSVQENDKYFSELENVKDEMKANGILEESEWMPIGEE